MLQHEHSSSKDGLTTFILLIVIILIVAIVLITDFVINKVIIIYEVHFLLVILSNEHCINCGSLDINSSQTNVVRNRIVSSDILGSILAISIIIIIATQGTTASIKHIPCFTFNNYKPILVPLVLYIKHL